MVAERSELRRELDKIHREHAAQPSQAHGVRAPALAPAAGSTFAAPATDGATPALDVEGYLKERTPPKVEPAGQAPATSPLPKAFRSHPMLHLDNPEVIARAREVLGDGFADAARASAEAIRPTFAAIVFDQANAMKRHTLAAILAREAEGREVDPAEVEAEAAAESLREWFARPDSSLARLASSAREYLGWQVRAIEEIDASLGHHAMLLRRSGRVDQYAALAGPEVERRETLLSRASRLNEARKALTPAVARMVGAAVEEAGGFDRVALLVRQAIMATGPWPGPDHRLEELEAKLLEASERMKRLRSIDPQLQETPMAEAARAERDALLPEVEARRLEVERAAIGRIEATVRGAISGEAEALSRLVGHAKATPSAFPDGFVRALARVPLAAAMEAGALGFVAAL